MITTTRLMLLAALLAMSPALAWADGTAATAQLACVTGAEAWSRTELYFGLSRKAAADITDAEFQGFVDQEVTPRFPDGLTLLTGYGQWRNSEGTIVKEGSKLLILLHPGGPEADQKLDEVREAYKSKFDQESVLRVDEASCVSF